jgi:diguanylate cyclase (GGDEF)-like protein
MNESDKSDFSTPCGTETMSCPAARQWPALHNFRFWEYNVCAMDDLVLQIDMKGTLLKLSGGFVGNLLDLSDDCLGKNIRGVMSSDITDMIMAHIDKALKTEEPQLFEYQPWMSEQHYEVRLVVGGQDRVFVILSNISDYRRAAERAKYLAHHDTLTELPNRYLFNDRLRQAIARAQRDKQLLAVLFIDIDNFKHINDTIGHRAGDQLLQSIATRLMMGIRKADSISRPLTEEPEHMVARLGGDEFIMLLTDTKDMQAPAKVARRVLGMLSEPFVIGAQEVFVTASVGIAVYPLDGEDTDTLLMNADVAMYQAKNNGRNNYQYYSDAVDTLRAERFAVENKLRKALDRNQFMLFYQPQIDISTGKVIGVEALIRWLQPDLVLIKPDEFIPLAEETGLIIPIGEWVLRAACAESRVWQKGGMRPIRMTVNVSSIQFRQNNFVEVVSGILRDTGMDPRYLQLELTEGTIMQDSANTIKKLHSLQAMGIQVAIDDFGTGYSSLNYLKRFPLSTLKIDCSFVKDIDTSPADQAIINAIVNLAHNFNLKVIAEGVEKKGQLTFLRGCGCEGAQGHLICPPVNAIVLAEFIKKESHLEVLRYTK